MITEKDLIDRGFVETNNKEEFEKGKYKIWLANSSVDFIRQNNNYHGLDLNPITTPQDLDTFLNFLDYE